MPDFLIPGQALTREQYYAQHANTKPMVRRHNTDVSPGAGVWCNPPGRMVPVADHQQTDVAAQRERKAVARTERAAARKAREQARNAARPSRAKSAVMTVLRAQALSESKELRDGNTR